MLTALELINEIAPTHSRTSCDPANGWAKNAYFNEMGHSRCVRCALLHRIEEGEFPYGAKMICEMIKATDFGSRPQY